MMLNQITSRRIALIFIKEILPVGLLLLLLLLLLLHLLLLRPLSRFLEAVRG
jgi:hypothetical protein